MVILSENFRLRGAGSEWNLPCFVSGAAPEGKRDLKENISGFVDSKKAGKRIVKMFNGLASLDYRPSEPQWIQVKIGVAPEYKKGLEALADLILLAGNRITPAMVAAARDVGLLQIKSPPQRGPGGDEIKSSGPAPL